MSIATRLVLAVGAVLVIVMAVYGFLAQRQREALLGAAHLRDTEVMARLVASVLADATRDGRTDDVTALLERAREHPEVVALALLNGSGRPVAGEDSGEAECLRVALEAAGSAPPSRGSMECGGRVDWAVQPLGVEDASVVVARRATALEREVASSRSRVVLVTLILTLSGAGVIVLILRRSLSAPLDAMLVAVERFANPRYDEPVSVPQYSGELGELATAFNSLDRRLEEKRRWIVREVEERLELEGRLKRAERFAAVGRIAGGLSHELGSPVNAIGVRAEAIVDDPGVTRRARVHAEEIVAEVERVGQLVRSLSYVGRDGTHRPRELDLADVVRQVVDDIARTAEEAGIEITTDLPGEAVPVSGDPALLRHAIWNLAINAVQAICDDHRPSDPPRRLRVTVGAEGDDVRVEVVDDGPGISEEILPHIFEPFFTTKDVGEGTGLGLAIALGIAERHGGSLRIESGDEGGVRAILTLPRGVPEGDVHR